jgi:hypothetical protein
MGAVMDLQQDTLLNHEGAFNQMAAQGYDIITSSRSDWNRGDSDSGRRNTYCLSTVTGKARGKMQKMD